MEPSRELLDRIRGEFREMPDLKITIAQACRLWNLAEALCRYALDLLRAEGFLVRTPSGAYIALPSATRMANASGPDHLMSSRCPHCQHLNSIPGAQSSRSPVPMTFRCVACSRPMRVEASSA